MDPSALGESWTNIYIKKCTHTHHRIPAGEHIINNRIQSREGWIPGHVTDGGVDDEEVWLEASAEILQDALHVGRVDAAQEVVAHQVVLRAVLTHLPVVGAIAQGPETATFNQAVVFK